MTKYLTRKFILAFFLSAFALIPAAYAQQPFTVSVSAKSSVVKSVERREQIDVDAENFIRTELFFGRNKPDGTEVSAEEFNDFLNVTITPEFPDGLTVLDGIGQFRDASGNTIREKAKVLILLYPSNTKKQSSRKIERIRTAYKNRFEQQSVLRVDDVLPVRVSF
jgi:Protein of unknown function (DUF3574)